jgi:hypothetical protein
MTWRDVTFSSFSAVDSQYLEGRKFSREEVARAYHIPLPMVGILDHATFSNIEEQHRNLYQDCLGPWLVMLQQELDLQLVGDFPDVDDVYCEFNLAEKMRGSFTEQAQSFSTLVGRPVMTANEARARMNLPMIEGDADELVTPLNVLVGGQASPRDSAPTDDAPKSADTISQKTKPLYLPSGEKAIDVEYPRIRARHIAQWTQVVAKQFDRQRNGALASIPKGAKAATTIDAIYDLDRWTRELADELFKLGMFTASEFARRVAEQTGIEFDPDELLEYYRTNAVIAADGINRVTQAAIVGVFTDPEFRDAVGHVFDVAVQARAPQIARTKVTQAANNGSYRAATSGGFRTKTWQVNSGNPRSQHAAMAGETVTIGQRFSNDMLWPGDPSAPVGADDIANCECSVTFS